jgi:hypothetical protein
MRLLLAIVSTVSLVLVAGQPKCTNTCLCNTGTSKNVPDIWPNATVPVLCGEPPGMCEVCSGCNQLYPKCPCCNPLNKDADSCFNCRLQEKNPTVCGKPEVTYSCDHNESQCYPKATGGAFPTKAACDITCQPSYNCQNKGQGDQCITAPGTTGTFANLSACNASCSTAPLSPCGRVKPAQCNFWQELFDATGGTPPYPGAPNNWKGCSLSRDDPCSCGGRNCNTSDPVCVTCANGDITAV